MGTGETPGEGHKTSVGMAPRYHEPKHWDRAAGEELGRLYALSSGRDLVFLPPSILYCFPSLPRWTLVWLEIPENQTPLKRGSGDW